MLNSNSRIQTNIYRCSKQAFRRNEKKNKKIRRNKKIRGSNKARRAGSRKRKNIACNK